LEKRYTGGGLEMDVKGPSSGCSLPLPRNIKYFHFVFFLYMFFSELHKHNSNTTQFFVKLAQNSLDVSSLKFLKLMNGTLMIA
jgi:hypothetical protein